jgi:hypothetical protein
VTEAGDLSVSSPRSAQRERALSRRQLPGEVVEDAANSS